MSSVEEPKQKTEYPDPLIAKTHNRFFFDYQKGHFAVAYRGDIFLEAAKNKVTLDSGFMKLNGVAARIAIAGETHALGYRGVTIEGELCVQTKEHLYTFESRRISFDPRTGDKIKRFKSVFDPEPEDSPLKPSYTTLKFNALNNTFIITHHNKICYVWEGDSGRILLNLGQSYDGHTARRLKTLARHLNLGFFLEKQNEVMYVIFPSGESVPLTNTVTFTIEEATNGKGA